jgi:hypothetical protein
MVLDPLSATIASYYCFQGERSLLIFTKLARRNEAIQASFAPTP